MDEPGARSLAVATESLVMMRVYRDQRMEHRAPVRCCVTPYRNVAMGGRMNVLS